MASMEGSLLVQAFSSPSIPGMSRVRHGSEPARFSRGRPVPVHVLAYDAVLGRLFSRGGLPPAKATTTGHQSLRAGALAAVEAPDDFSLTRGARRRKGTSESAIGAPPPEGRKLVSVRGSFPISRQEASPCNELPMSP